MTTILEAKNVKDLGLKEKQKQDITKKWKQGMSVKSISELSSISRRKVMRTLELEGLTYFSEGSYA